MSNLKAAALSISPFNNIRNDYKRAEGYNVYLRHLPDARKFPFADNERQVESFHSFMKSSIAYTQHKQGCKCKIVNPYITSCDRYEALNAERSSPRGMRGCEWESVMQMQRGYLTGKQKTKIGGGGRGLQSIAM